MKRCLIVLAAVVAVSLAGTGMVVRAQPQGAKSAPPAKAAPRTADGHPDLNGMWYRRVAGPVTKRIGKSIVISDEPDPSARARRDYTPGTPTYKPELLAKIKELKDDQINADPSFHCGPPGIPRIGPPQRIVQNTREVVFLYDDLNGNFFRLIPTDGRRHRTGIEPSSLGDSVGRWEGDTLVVDVTNIAEETWLGDNGLFHSDKTHVVERITRVGDTVKWEATIEDPEVLLQPWKVNPRTLTLMTNTDIEEAAFCEDRGTADRVTSDYHGNVR